MTVERRDSPDRRGWHGLLRSRGIQWSAAVVIVAALLAHALARDGGVDRLARSPAGAAALVVAQALIAVSPFPSQIVAVPVAVLYGFWPGLFLIWAGWMLAAVLQYALSRRTADDIDLAALLERAPRWMRRFPADHPLFLVLARQLPVGPHIVNISAGVLRVPWRRHLGCAAIAIVPEALLVSGLAVGLFGDG